MSSTPPYKQKVRFRFWCSPSTVESLSTATLFARELAVKTGKRSLKAPNNAVVGAGSRMVARRLYRDCIRAGLDPDAILAAAGKPPLKVQFKGVPRDASGALTRKRGKR